MFDDANLGVIIFKSQAFLVSTIKFPPDETIYKIGEQGEDYLEDYKYFEVIGNIYENKELLK